MRIRTVRVTGYVSATLVNIAVLEQTNQGYFPATSLQATTSWVETQWSSAAATLGFGGFPTSVAFHEGRLGWFGAAQAWLSASDDFTNFADIKADGTSTGDSGADHRSDLDL